MDGFATESEGAHVTLYVAPADAVKETDASRAFPVEGAVRSLTSRKRIRPQSSQIGSVEEVYLCTGTVEPESDGSIYSLSPDRAIG